VQGGAGSVGSPGIAAARPPFHDRPVALAPEIAVTAFNTVRFRIEPGREAEFLDAHRGIIEQWPGLRRASIVRTGERAYCLIAEWPDMETLAGARPQMIATLGTFRAVLEDLGEGRGVTDAVAGPVVLELAGPPESGA
jgi:hypothetical protein